MEEAAMSAPKECVFTGLDLWHDFSACYCLYLLYGKQMGENGNSGRFYFLGLQNHYIQ